MAGGEGTVIRRMVIKDQDFLIVHVLRTLAAMLGFSGDGCEPEKILLRIKSHLALEAKRLI